MRVLVRPTRWIALGACLVALAAAMPVATAGADPDVVAMSTPADKSTQVGDVHLQMTTGGGDYDKVGFSFSKSKKGTPVALFLEVDAPTSPGVWDYTWDSTMLPNGKYYVTPAAHHPNDVVVHGAPILI